MRRPALLVALAACQQPIPIQAPVPAEVVWIALLEIDGSGALVKSSALTRWAGRDLPLLSSESATLMVVGWSDAQISAASRAGTTADELAADPLLASTSCEHALPPPLYAARWRADATLEPRTSAEVPRLTAPWVEPRCAPPAGLWIDADCRDQRCVIDAPTSACGFSLDLASCALGVVTGANTALELCAEVGDRTCAAEPDAAARLAQRCESAEGRCALRWYTDIEPPSYGTDRVDLRLGDPWTPPGAETPGPLDPLLLRSGHAWALAVVGANALVSTTGARPLLDCEPGVEGAIKVVNDRAVLATERAPPCLMELDAVRGSSVAIGVFEEAGEWMLGRFSAMGRAVDAPVRADPRATGEPGDRKIDATEWRPSGLARVGGAWVVSFRRLTGDGAVLIAFDDGLRVSSRRDLGVRDLDTLRPGPGTSLLLVERRTSAVLRVSAAGALEREQPLTSRADEAARHVYAPFALGDRILVSTGAPAALHALTMEGTEGRAPVIDADVAPIAVIALPWAPTRLLASSIRPDRSSTLTPINAETLRFLPGTRALSSSPVTRWVVDARGRIWGLAPWQGEVLVLSEPP